MVGVVGSSPIAPTKQNPLCWAAVESRKEVPDLGLAEKGLADPVLLDVVGDLPDRQRRAPVLPERPFVTEGLLGGPSEEVLRSPEKDAIPDPAAHPGRRSEERRVG